MATYKDCQAQKCQPSVFVLYRQPPGATTYVRTRTHYKACIYTVWLFCAEYKPCTAVVHCINLDRYESTTVKPSWIWENPKSGAYMRSHLLHYLKLLELYTQSLCCTEFR